MSGRWRKVVGRYGRRMTISGEEGLFVFDDTIITI
jgi:hypothetical protein